MNVSTEHKLGKVEDVMMYAGISRGKLYSLLHQGLPHIKIGKSIRFDMDTVKAWLKSKEVSK